ncbi:hypothetical protein TNCV_981361 [Trichonephila clavipes]|uniref:Uncharacterized protein n=1 Tax=Trichonephila clavipes TaxID=2585209 RepID=A0A8X6RYP5_TRICX|nr:hypothetical protein TNCV_981361 [Trichonephila clavipes]
MSLRHQRAQSSIETRAGHNVYGYQQGVPLTVLNTELDTWREVIVIVPGPSNGIEYCCGRMTEVSNMAGSRRSLQINPFRQASNRSYTGHQGNQTMPGRMLLGELLAA